MIILLCNALIYMQFEKTGKKMSQNCPSLPYFLLAFFCIACNYCSWTFARTKVVICDRSQDFEVSSEEPESVQWGEIHYCPGGFLFPESQELAAPHDFRYNRFCAVSDICQSDFVSCGLRRQTFHAQLLLGNFTITDNLEILENAPGNPAGECGHISSAGNEMLSRRKRTLPGDTVLLVPERADPDQFDMTKRLFYFMAGLNQEDITPNDQLIRLLENVFRAISQRCDPMQLNPLFLNTTHTAFLWLLKQEAKVPPGSDISPQDIQRMTTALDECALKSHKPIRVIRDDCADTISHVVLEQEGIEGVWEYIYDDKVFKWGKYDPIIDAVWLAIDTLNGLCEKELADQQVNHHFESYMLRLLAIPRIETRWRTPTTLLRQEVFDQMFLAPVNESVAILDACCVAAWKSSSYLARNIRPIDLRRRREQQLNSNRIKRKKRMIGNEVTDGLGSKSTAYCFRSDEDRMNKLPELRKSLCMNDK